MGPNSSQYLARALVPGWSYECVVRDLVDTNESNGPFVPLMCYISVLVVVEVF